MTANELTPSTEKNKCRKSCATSFYGRTCSVRSSAASQQIGSWAAANNKSLPAAKELQKRAGPVRRWCCHAASSGFPSLEGEFCVTPNKRQDDETTQLGGNTTKQQKKRGLRSYDYGHAPCMKGEPPPRHAAPRLASRPLPCLPKLDCKRPQAPSHLLSRQLRPSIRPPKPRDLLIPHRH